MGTKTIAGLLAAAFAMIAALPAAPASADEVKVGVIGSFTGPYADWGRRFREGVELYLAQHDGKAGGHPVSIIYRDDGGNNPARAKQLAQELIVRDNVELLAGLDFTPTVFAVADVITEAKMPFVIFNSASSEVVRKSPYFVRAGFTQWDVCVTAAQYAIKTGSKRAILVVADYAPGMDSIEAFNATVPGLGGKIADVIKVPLGTFDYSSYIQRMKDDAPDTIFTFNPGGPMSQALVKAYIDSGMRDKGVRYWAGGGETEEQNLPNIGEAGLGLYAASPYSVDLETPVNRAFVKGIRDTSHDQKEFPNVATVEAYDGMAIVFHMIEATDGKRDGVKAIEAAKGFKWVSPRGPVEIDPKTRDLIQNVYILQVSKIDGVLRNKVIYTFPSIKDPWKELHPEG
jgi:branched-chain amino acid transport system substrate-binding protein